MEKENLTSVLQELSLLFECYKHLEEWSKEQGKHDAAIAGQQRVYTRMYNILDDDAIWAIIGTNEPYPLEDYAIFVLQDTPKYINRLKNHINSL